MFAVNFTVILELLPRHPQDTKQSWPGVSKPQSQLLQTKLTGKQGKYAAFDTSGIDCRVFENTVPVPVLLLMRFQASKLMHQL